MYRYSTSKMNTNVIQSIIQILSIGRSEMHSFELAHLQDFNCKYGRYFIQWDEHSQSDLIHTSKATTVNA